VLHVLLSNIFGIFNCVQYVGSCIQLLPEGVSSCIYVHDTHVNYYSITMLITIAYLEWQGLMLLCLTELVALQP
jgi:hypothetical protein